MRQNRFSSLLRAGFKLSQEEEETLSDVATQGNEGAPTAEDAQAVINKDKAQDAAEQKADDATPPDSSEPSTNNGNVSQESDTTSGNNVQANSGTMGKAPVATEKTPSDDGKVTDGTGNEPAPGNVDETPKRTDVGAGGAELAKEADVQDPAKAQPNFQEKAPAITDSGKADDPNNPGDGKPEQTEPAANVNGADKYEGQTEGEGAGPKTTADTSAEGYKGQTEGGTVSKEELDAQSAINAGVDAYERGRQAGLAEAAAAAGGEAAPAEAATPEQAASEAAQAVAQAAADAASAAATDIANGGTGDVNGVADTEGDLTDGLPADVTDPVTTDTPPAEGDAGEGDIPTGDAAEAAAEAGAGGETTAQEAGDAGEGSTDAEVETEKAVDEAVAKTEEANEADNAAKEADDNLEDLDELEEDEEATMESLASTIDHIEAMQALAQESLDNDGAGLPEAAAKMLNLSVEELTQRLNVEMPYLSVEAYAYLDQVQATREIMDKLDTVKLSVEERLTYTEEGFLDIFRTRTQILENWSKDTKERVAKLRNALRKVKTKEPVTVKDVGQGDLNKRFMESSNDLENIISGYAGDVSGPAKELAKLATRLRSDSKSEVDATIAKILAVKVPVPPSATKPGLNGIRVVYDGDDVKVVTDKTKGSVGKLDLTNLDAALRTIDSLADTVMTNVGYVKKNERILRNINDYDKLPESTEALLASTRTVLGPVSILPIAIWTSMMSGTARIRDKRAALREHIRGVNVSFRYIKEAFDVSRKNADKMLSIISKAL